MSLGTRLYTLLWGVPVGTDRYGNRYFRGKRLLHNRERRWVLYNGAPEASKVPAEWHGWLHHTFAEPPTKAPLRTQVWEMPHQPTGALPPTKSPPDASAPSRCGRFAGRSAGRRR